MANKDRILLVTYDDGGISFDDAVGLDDWETDWLWEEIDGNYDLYLKKGYGSYKYEVGECVDEYDEYGIPVGVTMEVVVSEFLTFDDLAAL